MYGPIAPFIWIRKPRLMLHLAAVVHPGDAEHDDPLGLDDPLEDLGVAVLGVLFENQGDRLGDLCDGLVELGLRRVLRLHVGEKSRDVFLLLVHFRPGRALSTGFIEHSRTVFFHAPLLSRAMTSNQLMNPGSGGVNEADVSGGNP